MVVQASALKKTKSHAAYLVFLDSAIGFEFDAQDELGRNGLDTSRDLAHLIHALVDEGAKFLVDSCAPLSPLRRCQSFLDRFGGGEKLEIVCQRVLVFGVLLDGSLECLLEQASDPSILSTMWPGWAPWL